MLRHCLTLDLRDDPASIAAYDRYHRAVWPEVLDHLRLSGIHDMTIWRRGNRLTMLIETAPSFDLAQLVVTASSHPRVKEWEQLMATFQQPLADAQGAGLWQPMDEVFNLHAQSAGENGE
ncbi:L-rhamnose mutarotase [Paraburkholderia acidicola]|uniref:L-rhamnose mutarotase n=1 Tax=Paraburkholderia acidicola TaxID=1912599 RepID=UPI001A969EF3|nr:L-rhamnose mutarotase [Paraburkholderia acidicola]